jgi:hypothetical protein
MSSPARTYPEGFVPGRAVPDQLADLRFVCVRNLGLFSKRGRPVPAVSSLRRGTLRIVGRTVSAPSRNRTPAGDVCAIPCAAISAAVISALPMFIVS